jgi:hypothetical protein
MEELEVPFPTGARRYLLYSIHTGSGAHPASYPIAIGALPHLLMKVKNAWSYNSAPPYILME